MDIDGAAGLWVLVPVKPFADAKQRLAPLLDQAARETLARAMLARTLAVAQQARGIVGIVVVSRDEAALQMAREHGMYTLAETTPGLNAALEAASQSAIGLGAQATLVIPIDLPALVAADIEAIARLGNAAPCVVLSPANQDGGTNALLLNPAGLIAYAFGAESFVEHRRRAQQAGARVAVYESDRTGFDVDRPADLELATGI